MTTAKPRSPKRRLKRWWRNLRRRTVHELRERRFPRHVEHVHGELPEAKDDGVIVATVMRDAAAYVGPFLEHHFALGVRHAVLVDNGSTDDTLDIATSYDDVSVYRTPLPFRDYKLNMKSWASVRAAERGWALYMDIDEHFDYPGSGVVSLTALVGYLDEHDFTAMPAFMVDMVPHSLAEADDRSFVETHVHYDIDDVVEIPPRPHWHLETTEPATGVFKGGIRSRVFGLDGILLSKYPLFRLGPGRRLGTTHHVEGTRAADATAWFKHYKFLPGFRAQVERAVAERQYFDDSLEYKAYASRMAEDPDLSFEAPGLRVWDGPEPLIEAGIVRCSDRYRAFVDTFL